MRGWQQPTSGIAIEEAGAKAEDMAENLSSLFLTFSNNAHLVYGPKIAEAIPISKAALAVTELQTASFGWGLIRLMALWDKPSRDRASIPTVAVLMSDAEVKAALRRKNLDDWRRMKASDHECSIRQSAFDRLWIKTFRIVEATQGSRRVSSLRHFRDSYIAHNLKPPSEYKSPQYGQEVRLLRTTSRALHGIMLLITNTDYGFAHDARQAKDVAADLWSNMHFTIQDQSPEALEKMAQDNRPARHKLRSRQP